MLGAMRAAAAAAYLAVSDVAARVRKDALAVGERLAPQGAVDAAICAPLARAWAASLWMDQPGRQCLLPSRFMDGATPARLGAPAHVTGLALAAADPTVPIGARALWMRLREAGFSVADDGVPERLVNAPRAVGVVRVLKEAPSRPRRRAWTDDGARWAA